MTPEARLDRALAPVRRAVESGRIPGAALGLVTSDGARAAAHLGDAQIQPQQYAVEADTLFDLASLTKVIFTTERILALAGAGEILLDDPLTVLIPDLCQYRGGGWQRALTFRDCLAHRTGLPNVHPIYTYDGDPERLRAFVLQRDWPCGAGVYSDINFILLGIALERRFGMPLHAMDPGPGFTFRPDPARTAATEFCHWRGRMLVGEVHDENCAALRGSGHAGLFGTLEAVLRFGAAVLARPAGHAVRQIVPGYDAEGDPITRGRGAGAIRTHGWELRHDGWSGGDTASAGAIGHTGFTGTGLWVDHARGIAWTLLTNRVHPSRHADSGIHDLRRAVGDLILQE